MRITRALVPLALGALAFTATAQGQTPTPFPGSQITGDVFVMAHTVNADNAMTNFFRPGDTVYFRSYAVDGKTRKLLTGKQAKYYYVKVPGAANVKMSYSPRSRYATGRYRWIGRWTVPGDYRLGIVHFGMLVKTKSKRNGIFHQVGVPTTQLTITLNPPAPWGAGPGSQQTNMPNNVRVAVYADTVNGTAPPGAVRRPIGCTQTNVYKRGERLVVRAWGFDLTNGQVLTIENVADARFSIAGVPDVQLQWGPHGPAGNRVWFWAYDWVIPANYPLGDVAVVVKYRLIDGKTGALTIPITIVP